MQLIASLRIEMIVDYCIFEHVPKEQSRTYRNLLIVFGEEYADQFTYEMGPQYDHRVAVGT